jgi:hypothetical protein
MFNQMFKVPGSWLNVQKEDKIFSVQRRQTNFEYKKVSLRKQNKLWQIQLNQQRYAEV